MTYEGDYPKSKAEFVIENGTTWDTIRAFHRWLGDMISGAEGNVVDFKYEPTEAEIRDLNFVDAYEGIGLTLHPPRVDKEEDGEITVGSSYSGYSSGFYERYKLGYDEKGPFLRSSEEGDEWYDLPREF